MSTQEAILYLKRTMGKKRKREAKETLRETKQNLHIAQTNFAYALSIL
jgi:hypothetical protein